MKVMRKCWARHGTKAAADCEERKLFIVFWFHLWFSSFLHPKSTSHFSPFPSHHSHLFIYFWLCFTSVFGTHNIIIKMKPMRYQILPLAKRFMIIMKIICVRAHNEIREKKEEKLFALKRSRILMCEGWESFSLLRKLLFQKLQSQKKVLAAIVWSKSK